MKLNNFDYITFYAEKLKNDNSYFKHHKKFIESQFKASQSFFINQFGKGEEFKINARKYLKARGII